MAPRLLLACALLTCVRLAATCSCTPSRNLRTGACDAPSVFIGQVIAQWDDCAGNTGTCQTTGTNTFVVRVLETLKGPTPDDGIALITSRKSGGVCGLQFALNGVFLFNARPLARACGNKPPTYVTGRCDFSTAWTALTDVDKTFFFTRPFVCNGGVTSPPTSTSITVTTTGITTPGVIIPVLPPSNAIPVLPSSRR